MHCIPTLLKTSLPYLSEQFKMTTAIHPKFSDRQSQVNGEEPDQKMQKMTSNHGLNILFVIHPAILDTSTGSKLNLLKFLDRSYGLKVS